MDSCRVCMDEKADLSDIFTSDIADKIFFCTGIQITKDDGLPSQICDVCFNNLSIAYNFKTQCLLTERTLKNINIDIKYDVTEESGNTDEGVGNDFDLKEEESEVDVHIKVEPVDNRRSTRIKLMKIESITENEVTKVRKKRGPYKKTGQTRLSKFKYRKLFCEPCGLKFMDKEESDKHKKEIHKGESFICEICGKVFVHRASHYSHVRSHLPPQYACDSCDYRTPHKHDLIKHLRIHTGVKLYQCKHCTASYHASSNLTSHIRRCHTRERRHACHLCDRAFYDRTKLNRHIDSHNDIKRFECDICHACFSRRCYWKKHLQRQHGVVVPPQRPGRQKTNRQVGTGSHTNVMAL
ncbi:PREDICTED: zinc finger protein 2-like isoform X1 [Papilio polytes]|uniref:zinc finger protein 2-like isoform X1 n=1 Tax=Papilio polytes TaxID=76194 RepID=UPI0006760983|nr:PREDICTED: zinc finger protein 2-like isoform X1 [Papilio polytes]